MSDLETRAVATITADAKALGTDLTDTEARTHFIHGIEASYAWLTAAHETGKLDAAAFKMIEETIAMQITAARAVRA